jgi:hypothetical protein
LINGSRARWTGTFVTRLLAAVALVVIAGALVGGAHASRHRHDSPGLYDVSCPLAEPGIAERSGTVPAIAMWTPLAPATALVAGSLAGDTILTPAADAQLRAPPIR